MIKRWDKALHAGIEEIDQALLSQKMAVTSLKEAAELLEK